MTKDSLQLSLLLKKYEYILYTFCCNANNEKKPALSNWFFLQYSYVLLIFTSLEREHERR